MADVTSWMDGNTSRPMPEGQVCDNGCGNPAAHRVLVESDSFGSEYADLCDACYEQHCGRRRAAAAKGGICDWCKKQSAPLITTRDVDEGMHGPTYRVCKRCYDRQQRACERELEASGYYEEW